MENNVELCSNIKDGDLRSLCFSKIVKILQIRMDLDICKRISNEKYYSECVSTVAVENSDADICKRISNEKYYSECVSTVAVENSDAD